jgi:hypothetical protein
LQNSFMLGMTNLVLTIVFVWIAICVLLYIVGWVLESLGLMRMAGKIGFKDPWLAWIPGASMYVFMVVAGEKQRKMGIAYLFLSAFGFIPPMIVLYSGMIPAMINAANSPMYMMNNMFASFGAMGLGYTLLIMVSLAVMVVRFILQYHIFYRFRPQSATGYTVGTILGALFLCNILGGAFMLAASKGEPDQSLEGPSPSSPGSTFTPPPAA